MQLVFEFCAPEARSAIEAVQRVIGESGYTLRGEAAGTGIEIVGGFHAAATMLESGELDSFTAYPKTVGAIRYGMVTKPLSGDEPRSLYMGTIEYTARDYGWIWDLLLSLPRLTVVCLGYEEGVELRDGSLESDTFPWNQWPLVIGAVRKMDPSGSGTWTIKKGPEMRWFEGGPAAA
jgi:hypothetical protein